MNRRDFLRLIPPTMLALLLPKGIDMTIQNYSGDYFIKMLKDLYTKTGVQPPQSDLDTLQRLVDEERAREEKVKSWARVADAKIGMRNLDLPIVPIDFQYLSENTTEIELRVPPDYKHLLIISSGRVADSSPSGAVWVLGAHINNDTGNNYARRTSTGLSDPLGYLHLGNFIGDDADTGELGVSFSLLTNYANNDLYKRLFFVTANPITVGVVTSWWKNTSPVETMKFFSGTSMMPGSTISIYGIK